MLADFKREIGRPVGNSSQHRLDRNHCVIGSGQVRVNTGPWPFRRRFAELSPDWIQFGIANCGKQMSGSAPATGALSILRVD